MDEKEIRKQVGGILGRELSNAEFQGIDFSGVIEEIEPGFDDLMKLSFLTYPATLFVGGIACHLLGIGIQDRSAFLAVQSCFIFVSAILDCTYLWKKKRTDAKKRILEAIRKYEERNEC